MRTPILAKPYLSAFCLSAFCLSALCLSALCLSACATRPPETPEEIIIDIESRLLQAQRVAFDFEIQAIGVVNAKLEGRFELDGDLITLSYHGSYGQHKRAGRFTADATTMISMVNEKSKSSQRPTHLKEGLLIGLTRMGLLHNLAGLQGGSFPEHCSGGAQKTLELRNLNAGSDRAVVFDLIVRGRHSASGSLWIDGPVPTMRKQSVYFDQGSMEVNEQYRNFELR